MIRFAFHQSVAVCSSGFLPALGDNRLMPGRTPGVSAFARLPGLRLSHAVERVNGVLDQLVGTPELEGEKLRDEGFGLSPKMQ